MSVHQWEEALRVLNALPDSPDDLPPEMRALLGERAFALGRRWTGRDVGRGSVLIRHLRPYDFDERKKEFVYRDVDEAERVEFEGVRYNFVTNANRILYHTQMFVNGAGSTGMNYIGLSSSVQDETATSTTVSGELTTNGLARTQVTPVPPTGAGNQTTLSNTFTFSGSSQAVQKTFLANASSSGTVGHMIQFTSRTLVTNDKLVVPYTITLG